MLKSMSLLMFVFLVLVTKSESAKILAIFQWPSISHHMVFRHLTGELARRGHEVTVITTDAAFPKGQAPANLTEIDLHDVSYDIWKKAKLKSLKEDTDFLSQIELIGDALSELLEAQFQSVEVQKLLNERKDFDLLLIEASVRHSLIFSNFYKVPVIMISTFGTVIHNDRAFGMPTHPLIYPSMFSEKHYNHTVIEKITEIYHYFLTEWYFGVKSVENENKLLRSVFGPNVPSVEELYENVDMLFLNTHPLWASNVPVPPFSYRENIIKLRDVMRDEPQSALERAVWWTEYVLRHKGAKHLRAAGAHLSYSEYYEIPLISAIFLGLLFICFLVVILVKQLITYLTKSSLKLKKN